MNEIQKTGQKNPQNLVNNKNPVRNVAQQNLLQCLRNRKTWNRHEDRRGLWYCGFDMKISLNIEYYGRNDNHLLLMPGSTPAQQRCKIKW